jgi:tetratricopeptide (TPR) repeat protein
MRGSAFTLCLLLGLAAAPAVSGQPGAQDEQGRQAALPLAEQGLAAFDADRFSEAADLFQRAEALFHAPTHVFYIARASEKIGKLLEAQRLYRQLVDEALPAGAPGRFREVQEHARLALEPLNARIPSLSLEVRGMERARVSVTVDGQPWADWGDRPLRLNPGEHSLQARGEGATPVMRTVRLVEGQNEKTTIDLAPAADRIEAPEPAQGSYVPAAVAFGIGGAGLLVGTITGILSLNKVSELEERCPTKLCSAEDESLGDEAKVLGNVSTAGFVIGGIGLAAGVVLSLWRPFGAAGSSEAALTLRPAIGLGSLGLEGTF